MCCVGCIYGSVPKEAGDKRDELRNLLKNGNDPAELRKKQKIKTKENVTNSFENIAREWFSNHKGAMAERHAFYVIRRLEGEYFSFFRRYYNQESYIKRVVGGRIEDHLK